jgi:hypothetical protein
MPTVLANPRNLSIIGMVNASPFGNSRTPLVFVYQPEELVNSAC